MKQLNEEKMIPQNTLQQIIDQVDLVDVISRYIDVNKNLKAVCPFHSETKPSLSIHPSKKFWKCFSCGLGGNALNFIQKIEGISFIEAVKVLAKEAGVSLPESSRFKNYVSRRWESKKKHLENLESWRWHFRQAEINQYSQLRKERNKLHHRKNRNLWDSRDYLNEQIIDFRFSLLDTKMKKIDQDLAEIRKEIING